MSTTRRLLDDHRDLWAAITAHPFVTAAADGSLPPETFDRWLREDHWFVVGFRRFLARLVELAPDEQARDLLAGALGPLQAELDLFRSEAETRGLDLQAEPCPTNLGYTSFLLAAPADGWDVAVTVLWAAEQAYYDAWRTVRESIGTDGPYGRFIDNWSSPAFGAWVADLAVLVDRTVPDADEAVRTAFVRVARLELRFWDAVADGEDWTR